MTKTSRTSGAKNWNHHSMSIQYVKSPLFRSHLVDVQIEDPNKKKENIITQLLRQCQDYGEETGAKILNHSKWLLFPGTDKWVRLCADLIDESNPRETSQRNHVPSTYVIYTGEASLGMKLSRSLSRLHMYLITRNICNQSS